MESTTDTEAETPGSPVPTAGAPVRGAGHAAHHAAAGQAVTGTAALSGTMPMSPAMKGAGMADTMAQAGGMHGEIAAALGALLDEHAGTLPPEVAAELGRIQGLAESSGAMMSDMHAMAGMSGMMCGMMQGGMMQGGMMPGGMMQGGMMQGGMMGGMPMTATMPMSGMMQGMGRMMGMMHAMQADMGAMMENMPEGMSGDMAAHMAAMQAHMDAMMAMMEGIAAGASGGVQEMDSMDHGNMADASQPFDAQFIDSMIEHHQGAIDMANLVLEQSDREELRALAEEIIAAQEAEIDQMQEWRAVWYPDLPPTAGMGMEMGDMALADDTNVPFERRFIEAMISHHRGAVAMAEAVRTQAEHEELRQLAEEIIAAQETEIGLMVGWNDEWFPDLPPLPAAGAHSMSGTGSMGDMSVHAHMAAMLGDMQARMDEMMAAVPTMTPEQAAEMGRMMGRLEGMSSMMGMMEMPIMHRGMMHRGMMHRGMMREDTMREGAVDPSAMPECCR